MSSITNISDSFELAQDLQTDMLRLPFDRRVERAISALGMLALFREQEATFFIESKRAFIKPREVFSNENTIFAFKETAMEGVLDSFTYLTVGDISGMPINSLCASFRDVRLLPGGEPINPEHTMHVPALAIGMRLQIAS